MPPSPHPPKNSHLGNRPVAYTGRMGSVLQSTICHYCDARPRNITEDHIVPRAILPKPYYTLPRWYRDFGSVPSCKSCNNLKAFYRSTCDCPQCSWAWDTALALFLPTGYTPRGPIQVPAPPPPPPPRIESRRARNRRLAYQSTFRARTERALAAAQAQEKEPA